MNDHKIEEDSSGISLMSVSLTMKIGRLGKKVQDAVEDMKDVIKNSNREGKELFNWLESSREDPSVKSIMELIELYDDRLMGGHAIMIPMRSLGLTRDLCLAKSGFAMSIQTYTNCIVPLSEEGVVRSMTPSVSVQKCQAAIDERLINATNDIAKNLVRMH